MSQPLYAPGDVLLNRSGKAWLVQTDPDIPGSLQITDGISTYYLCKSDTKRPVELTKLATLTQLVSHWKDTHQ